MSQSLLWQWLTRILSAAGKPVGELSADALVADEHFQFKVGTKPKLPDGLRDLRITQLPRGLLLLENFNIDLTVDQKYMEDTVEQVASASRCLRWAKAYHGLDAELQPPVSLHR